MFMGKRERRVIVGRDEGEESDCGKEGGGGE
jgi:hypothetical protein